MEAPERPTHPQAQEALPGHGGTDGDMDNWMVDCILPGATEPVNITVKSCRDGAGRQVGKPTRPLTPITDGSPE